MTLPLPENQQKKKKDERQKKERVMELSDGFSAVLVQAFEE